jgi:hypothetical protein
MISTNSKFKYKGFKVEHLTSKAGNNYTKFVVGDSKKDNSGKWVNNGYYNCTSFQQDILNFKDGDEYTITKIQSIDRFEYNGNYYYNLIVEIQLTNNGNLNSGLGFGANGGMQQATQPTQNNGLDNFNSFSINDNDIQF